MKNPQKVYTKEQIYSQVWKDAYLENDSDEKVMVFTDNKALINLSGQINQLLLNRQKIKTDFKKQEIATKKMHSFPLF